MLTSIETTATVGPNRQLVLDDEIPAPVSRKVRVIVLFDEDVSDSEWLAAAAKNEAFEFLADEGEDIYTLADGNPISNEK
ncbi:MAG: hypothetical protein ACRD6X_05105 [Pyrinomonadaceae bacterium]